MIEVMLRPYGVKVSGHARAAPEGQDIVCAAVSVLVETLAASLAELTEDEVETTIEKGNARIQWKNLSQPGRTMVDSFFVGICGIAGSYPDYVTIV